MPIESSILTGGWASAGYTHNLGQPTNGQNHPMLFNDAADEFLLNQLYVYAEIPIDATRRFGGRVDAFFGSDSRFVTVPGLERHHDRSRKWNAEDSVYGLALPQAYLHARVDDSNTIKLGHFYSISGYEQIAAPENFFYSHSYAFAYSTPFTHTGALWTVQSNDRTQWNIGYTRGWDVWESNADEWGVLFGLSASSPDGTEQISFTLHTGEDITSTRVQNVPIVGNRTYVDLVYRRQLSDNCHYYGELFYTQQEDEVVIADTVSNEIAFGDANWYGFNQTVVHRLSNQTLGGLRFEWFRDDDHARMRTPVMFAPGGPSFTGGNYFSLSLGLNTTLNRCILLQPEIRWDWSDVRGNPDAPGGDQSVRAFGDSTDGSQISVAVNLVVEL